MEQQDHNNMVLKDHMVLLMDSMGHIQGNLKWSECLMVQ
jgi:hypothetical protein